MKTATSFQDKPRNDDDDDDLQHASYVQYVEICRILDIKSSKANTSVGFFFSSASFGFIVLLAKSCSTVA